VRAIDKIKKLLALSNSPNENEAAIALAKAIELCAENNISLSQVKAAPDGENIKHKDISKGRTKTPKWETLLATNLADMFNCVCVINNGFHNQKLQFAGYSSDAEICAYVYEFLHRQIPKITREHMKLKNFRKNARRNAYRLDFMLGVVHSVLYKAKKIFTKKQTDESSALMVQRVNLVKRFLKETGAKDSNINFKAKRKDALNAGYDAGRNVNIRRGVYQPESDSRPKQLGGTV